MPRSTLDHDPETKEMVLTGMSELHLMLIQERLKRRDKVEVNTKDPKVPYRETIQVDSEGSYRHKKQSGGSGQFAEVHVRMFPLPEGVDIDAYCTKDRFPHFKHSHYHAKSHFLWIDLGGWWIDPRQLYAGDRKGFFRAIASRRSGRLPRSRMFASKFILAKTTPSTVTRRLLKLLPAKCLPRCSKRLGPAYSNRWSTCTFTVPADSVGDVSSDLSGRRGQMVGMEQAGGNMTTVEAKAPLAEVSTYARTLSAMTGGQGSYCDGVRPLRSRPRQRSERDYCRGEVEKGGRLIMF